MSLVRMHKRLASLVLVVLATATGWWYWPSDERRVRARVEDLAAAVSVPAGEGELQRLSRLTALRRGLAEDVVIEATADVPALSGRDAAVGFAAQVASRVGAMTVDVLGMDVVVGAGGAVAQVIVAVRGEPDTAATRRFDGQELRLDLVEIDGDWVVRRVSPVSALERPE